MFKYWSMSRIKNLAMTFYLKASRTWRVQIQVFLPFCWFFSRMLCGGWTIALYLWERPPWKWPGNFCCFFGSWEPAGWTARFLWWILEGDARVSWTINLWNLYAEEEYSTTNGHDTNMVSFHWTTVSCVDSCPVLMVQGISGMWQIASIGSALIQQKWQNSRFWVGWESLDRVPMIYAYPILKQDP